jgi:hypothetical protein
MIRSHRRLIMVLSCTTLLFFGALFAASLADGSSMAVAIIFASITLVTSVILTAAITWAVMWAMDGDERKR